MKRFFWPLVFLLVFFPRLFYGFEIFFFLDEDYVFQNFVDQISTSKEYALGPFFENLLLPFGWFGISLKRSLFSFKYDHFRSNCFFNHQFRSDQRSSLIKLHLLQDSCWVTPNFCMVLGNGNAAVYLWRNFLSRCTLCSVSSKKFSTSASLLGASCLLYSVFLNSDLRPLLVLLYLFLIFNSLSDDFKSEGRSFFTLGVCALVSVLVILLSGIYGVFTNDSPSTFALTMMQIFKSFDGVAISSGFAKISRTLVKCFFSPFLLLIPLGIFTGLLKEVRSSKYSSWVLSLSICDPPFYVCGDS